MLKAAYLLLISALIASGCGGGDSTDPTTDPTDPDIGTNTPTVSFPGGTLSDLAALSPSLTFDTLEITGALDLPNYSSTTITANKFVITSTGSIGYSYGTCDYVDAPNLAVNVAGDVSVDGEIRLNGRSGTTVTSSATCKSCYGQDGGDISIIAGGNINASARISSYGGAGASVHDTWGSYSCSAGASGNLTLESGRNFTVSGSTINNNAGKNFDGEFGASGIASIKAASVFAMSSGSISTTGSLTFQAASTDIWGPITYGTLSESISGVTDTSEPLLLVLSPQAGSSLDWHQPVQIQIQASDVGMGLNSVQVTGLGIDQTYSGSELLNGTLTIEHPSVDTPETLNVVATDNKAFTTTISVNGLTITYPPEVEPNDTLMQAQLLDAGGIIEGQIMTGDSGSDNAAIQSYLQTQGDTSYATRQVQDWYLVTVTAAESISITLDFSGSATATDIDMYLLDSTGSTIAASSTADNVTSQIYTESIIKSGLSEGTYYIALQAFDVNTSTAYRLQRNY